MDYKRRQYLPISQQEWNRCLTALKGAFVGIAFATRKSQNTLFESYLENLEQMIRYAYSQSIDPAKYIGSIREYVLEYAKHSFVQKSSGKSARKLDKYKNRSR